MRKISIKALLISLLLLSLLSAGQIAAYDLDLMSAQCLSSEEKVVCKKEPLLSGFLYKNQCKKFALSDSYYLLREFKDTAIVDRIYCRYEGTGSGMVSGFVSDANYLISGFLAPLMFFVLVVELPLFFWSGLRTKKQLTTVIYMNFISVLLINLTLWMTPYGGPVLYAFALIFSALFEAGVLLTFYRSLELKKVLIASASSNFISFLVVALFLLLLNENFLAIWM